MTLTPEQIEEIATDWFSEEWAVARAIKLIEQVESEVRKQDEALIRQMLEALSLPCDRWNGTQSRIVREATNAGRAWLEKPHE